MIAVCILLFFVFFIHQDQYLILENGETDEVIYATLAADGFEFAVSFIHSVNKSDVIEGYRIEEGNIFAEWCKYSSFGAGMPTELGDGEILTYEDGKMMISHMHRGVPNLSYIVGTVYDHYLYIGDEKINLCDLTPRNTKVRFLVEKKYHIGFPCKEETVGISIIKTETSEK
ncbi:MAG: DUF1850 domain-containing protein [Peptococcaceae bacterium]|nr:DUF1850 domain-containing protein [Peptococcaceae bacterium]